MRTSIILFLVCASLLTNAQDADLLDTWPRLSVGFEPQLSLAHPINEFAATDTSDRVLFGIGGEFVGPVVFRSPLRVGLNVRYFWSGRETRRLDLVDSNGDAFELISKVKGSMVPVHVVLRIDPMNYTDFPLLPYIGGFAGIRFFGTNNQITYDYNDGSDPYVENDRELSVASSYGIELGLHFRIRRALFDFRYERAYGGTAKYLDMSSVVFNGQNEASYTRLETRTDVEIYSLGMVFSF